MATVNIYADVYPYMLPELPGCSKAMALQALHRAVRQLCIDTEVWWETLDSINLVEDQTEYTIDSTWEAEIRRIKELRINNADNIDAGNEGAVQDPSLYDFTPTDALELSESIKPAEDVTDGLEVDIWIVPRITAPTVDPTLLNDWLEPIIGWAMAFLMNMKRKKWSDTDRAAFYMFQYTKGRSKAKTEKIRKNKNEQKGLSA